MLRLFFALLLSVATLAAQAQTAQFLRQHDMAKWGIPAGNYSAIAHIDGNRYALVSDKQEADGWQEVTIDFDAKGDIRRMSYVGPHFDSASTPARDAEGIVVVRQPQFASGGTKQGEGTPFTVFISAESDQEILELDSLGRTTGRRLAVPDWADTSSIFGNYGFEALAYDARQDCFWTTTEQGLRRDVEARTSAGHPEPTLLRLLRFDRSLQLDATFAYRTDRPTVHSATRTYAFGVPELTVLDDSTLLVLEREVAVAPRFNGSYVHHRLYSVRPELRQPVDSEVALSQLPTDDFLPKTKVGEFTTHLRLAGRKNLANYEGMCLGPTLPDGRQTLILVADSQNRMGNALFRLKDYIRVAILNP